MSGVESKPSGTLRSSIAFGAALVLAALGEWALLVGRNSLGVAAIAAGAAAVAANWLLPAVLRRLKTAAPASPSVPPVPAPRGRRRQAAAAAGDAVEVPAETAVRPRVSPLEALFAVKRWFSAWRPLGVDEIRLNRYWLGLPLVPLGAEIEIGLAAGKVILPVFCLAAMGLIIAIFLQNPRRAIVIPNVNANLKAILSALLGAPLQILGSWLMWQYVYVMTGFLLVVLGGAWTLWSLSKMPLGLSLPEDGDGSADEWSARPPKPFFTWDVWQVKSSLILAAAVCAYGALVLFPVSNQGLSVVLGFVGMGLIVLSFPWLPAPLAEVLGLPKAASPAVALGLTAFAWFVASRGQVLMENGSTTAALWRFLAAGIAAVLALSPRPLDAKGEGAEAEPPRWAEFALVATLLVAAFAFHFWKVGIFPYGAEGDEAGGGIWGWDAMRGALENPLISGNVPLQFYSITGMFYKFFGLSMTTMRLHSVVFGTLSIASAYFFFRLFSGWAAALAASVLMLFSYWHLHYSRFGHYNIEQIYTQMVAFYFVFKGLKTGSYWRFVVGGVAFGLAMQPHLASRLLPFEGIAFLLFLVLLCRGGVRRNATGLLAFVVASWIVSSPSLMYWFRATGLSFGRAQSVSIFDKANTNAPADVLSGFVRNCEVSMLMFNKEGDTRSRDNPVAPEKVLESGMALLFAIAFLYGLYHWRQPGRYFLLAVFFINLSASVFSVEAPQSLRTSANIPIVFAMMAVWMGDLSACLAGWGRKKGLLIFLALALPLTAVYSYRSAWKYFVEKAGLSFDVAPTYVAMAAGDAQQQHPVTGILAATGFAVSHPPVILFKRDAEMGDHYNLAEFIPPAESSDRDLMLFLVDDYQQALPYLQSVFPDIKPQVLKNESRVGGQAIATYLKIPAAELAKRQGLRARARINGAWLDVGNSSLDTTSPGLKGANQIEWKGGLLVRHFGRYQFKEVGQGRATLKVDGKPVRIGQETDLALGVHSLEVAWYGPAGAPFHLEWSGTPIHWGANFNLTGPLNGPIPKETLWQDLAPRGFYGKYFASGDFTGTVLAESIEPVLLAHWLDPPIQGTWSGTWKARFKAPTPGHYRFRPLAMSFSEVLVNGKLVSRLGAPLKPELNPPKVQDGVDLKEGWNTVEMRYATTGGSWIELHWTGPGINDELMQPESLEPLKD
jgi:hypothetical protein